MKTLAWMLFGGDPYLVKIPSTRDFFWRFRRWWRGWTRCKACGSRINDVTSVGAISEGKADWCSDECWCRSP